MEATQSLLSFSQFDGIEVARRSRVENELEQLVSTLVDAAFELPDEIERRLEPEVRSINDVMIENRMAFTDLQARMKVSEIKLKDELHRQWEGRREAWRKLRHRRAIGIASKYQSLPSHLFEFRCCEDRIRGYAVAQSQRPSRRPRRANQRAEAYLRERHGSGRLCIRHRAWCKTSRLICVHCSCAS